MKKGKSNHSPFIVPIVFGVSDYEKAEPLYAWIYEVYVNYATRNNSTIIAQENYFKLGINSLDEYYRNPITNEGETKKLNHTLKKSSIYAIKNAEVEKIIGKEKQRYNIEVSLLTKKNDYLFSIIENRLDNIERDYDKKVDALMTWIWNPTLEAIAEKRNIKLISLELSPIRKIHTNHNYNTTLCYFQFSNKYDKSYCKNLYNKFLTLIDTEKIQIFSREELLSMFLNTEDLHLLKDIRKPPKYEIGLSPGFEQDAFFERYSSSKIENTIKKVESLFDTSEVSIRYHPNLENSRGNPSWNKDKSTKSIYWITQCKRIVSHISNIAFDAMMFGKTSYVLSEHMPFSFKTLNLLDWIDESVVDSLYLNFMIFGYFAPWNLVFDNEYIEWRLSEPNILDIYIFNRNYILELLKLPPTLGLLKQEKILRIVHNLDDKNIKEITKYNLELELTQLRTILKEKDLLLTNLREEISQKKNKLAQANIEIEQTKISLTDANKKTEESNKELMNIYNSKSWKITQPIRSVSKLIRDLFK